MHRYYTNQNVGKHAEDLEEKRKRWKRNAQTKPKQQGRTGTDRKTRGPETTGARPERDRNDKPGTDRKRIPGPGPEDRNETGTAKAAGPERDRNTCI